MGAVFIEYFGTVDIIEAHEKNSRSKTFFQDFVRKTCWEFQKIRFV